MGLWTLRKFIYNKPNMNITIDIGSAVRTSEEFKQRSAAIKGAVEVIIKKSIFVLEKYAKYYSPVDTGRMRASIGPSGYSLDGKFSTGEQSVEFGQNFATIMPTVTYAKYVQQHTPFMTAAAQDSLGEIEQIAKKEINSAIG